MDKSNLKKYQVFTPPKITEKMLDMAGYTDGYILGKKVLENSFGNGALLEIIVSRYVKIAMQKNVSLLDIKRQLEECFFGFEIDKLLFNETIKKLNKIVESYGIRNVEWNLFNEDYLLKSGLQDFDYIIGNPPYIKYQEIDKETRLFLKSNFESCSKGKFDYCYPFIEKSLRELKQNGKLVYLVPSSIFKNVFAENLRKIMIASLSEIQDYSGSQLFSGATTSSTILSFSGGNSLGTVAYSDSISELTINKRELKPTKWIFRKHKENGYGRRFGDYFEVHNSLATLKNAVFIHEFQSESEFLILENGTLIEEKATLKAFSPNGFLHNKQERIIFPYLIKNNRILHMSELQLNSCFPMTYEYLLSQRGVLESRAISKSSVWFEFGRSQGLSRVIKEKILVSSVMTGTIKPILLNKLDIPYSGFFITSVGSVGLEKGMKILKSKQMAEYLNSVGISMSGNSKRISVKDIENYKF